MRKIICPKCGGEMSVQDLVAWRPNECVYCGYVENGLIEEEKRRWK